MKKYLSIAALALVGAVMTSCSSDDNIIEEPQQPAVTNYSVTKTLRVSLDGGEAGARAITRALTSGGEKTFAVGDQIAVAYQNTSAVQVKAVSDALKAGDISGDGKTATFTVTFTEAPFEYKGNYVYYTYPASITTANGGLDYSVLNTQDGTLATLASSLDCCMAYSGWNGKDDLPGLTLTNRFTIGKFIIKNPSGTAINDDLTSVTISDGSNTYTITPTGSTFTSDPIWVAMQPVYEGSTVTVTATDGTNNYSKTITIASGKDLLAGSITPINVTMKLVPTGAINGLFTVNGSTKQVYFSQGNLQAVCASADADGSTQETWTWQFASNQYEVGTANSAINGNGSVSTAGTVDLFCWSTDATYYGISTITDNTGLQGAFVDWGGNIGSGWRSLTSAEWDYLFSGRTNAASKYGHGSVNGVNGMIILPDSWTLPDGLSFTSGNSAWTNSYTTAEWSQMESAGAVFLPAAGIHIGTDVYGVGSTGLYWSSSVYEDNKVYAFRLSFGDDSFLVSSDYGDKSQGCSVRLVIDAE